MKKQINGEKLRTLEAASNARAWDTCVYLENKEHHLFGNTAVDLGLNWTARGTQPTAEAYKLANEMIGLGTVCDKINARELEAVRMDGRLFESHEEYSATLYQLAEWLEEYNADAIIEWLEA